MVFFPAYQSKGNNHSLSCSSSRELKPMLLKITPMLTWGEGSIVFLKSSIPSHSYHTQKWYQKAFNFTSCSRFLNCSPQVCSWLYRLSQIPYTQRKVEGTTNMAEPFSTSFHAYCSKEFTSSEHIRQEGCNGSIQNSSSQIGFWDLSWSFQDIKGFRSTQNILSFLC